MSPPRETIACLPAPVVSAGFNQAAKIPYGCTVGHIRKAMEGFTGFLRLINQQLHANGMPRLESFLMSANFSSIVGEFMSASIPKHCPSLIKNGYHNGHPDLIPKGMFPGDAIQYAHEGIEIKASRYPKAWQGHNPEDSWLMVFVFDANGPYDLTRGVDPRPFRFVRVVGAALTKEDWKFSGRSAESRRTITASVTASGYEKMVKNWIYQAPDLP